MKCNSCIYGSVVLILLLAWSSQSCDGSGTLGFDIHHRFSDPVKAIFGTSDKLPEKGSVDYYAAMVHRDRVNGRRLVGNTGVGSPPLTFVAGNATYNVAEWGFIYYANVSLGTPETWYLVALDTGSSIFWLPCDCAPNCIKEYEFSASETIKFNLYSLRTSSTGRQLSCTSRYCENSCSSSKNQCPYRVDYLSANTSSSGYLVVDTIHLATDADPSTAVDADIAFGCGEVQTGSFLTSGAPNGLLGLSMDAISLPSVLASQKFIANSYSMCFSTDNIGRISFGDIGNKGQRETPIRPNQIGLHYVSITDMTVGNKATAANITVIFDTGTSFTHLNDPAYTLLTENFNSQVEDRRVKVNPDIFDYCYATTSSPDELIVPTINLTMRGGHQFSVIRPWIIVANEGDLYVYCLAITKSDHNINIIGENFMSGYRIVFDHERKIIGWKVSDCGEAVDINPDFPVPGYHGEGSATPESMDRSSVTITIFFIGLLTILLNSFSS